MLAANQATLLLAESYFQIGQDELAAQSGLHRSYVGTIERCEKAATLDTVERIAKAFGVKAGELFED